MAHGSDKSVAERVKNITQDEVYVEYLTKIITELSLSDSEARMLYETVNCNFLRVNEPFLKGLKEVMKYQGFNPKIMIRMLLKSHKRMKEYIRTNPEAIEVVSEEIKVNGETQRFKFNSNMSFESDMKFICLSFLTGGAVFQNFSKKSITQCMKILIKKYNINTAKRRPGTSLDNETITIRRIAASFPMVTVGFFHKGFGKSIVDPTILFPGTDLPRAIYSPMIASAIPKSEDAPLAILLAIEVKTDDILHQPSARSNLQTQFKRLMASYNSNALTESAKIESCVHWGLLKMANGKHTYIDAIVDSRQRAKEIIKELRPTDPALNNILSQI